MKLKEVRHLADYSLFVKFEDGTQGHINLEPLVQKGIFQVLKDIKEFSKAYSTGYSIAWSQDLEIDSDAVYMELTGKSIDELFRVNIEDATN